MIAINEWSETIDRSAVSVVNLHYVRDGALMGAMQGLDRLSASGKALLFDETEFSGSDRVRRYTPADARAEAWEFMRGDGSCYSNLALKLCTPQDEAGTAPEAAQLRAYMGTLKRFLDGLDLLSLRCDSLVLATTLPAGTFARAVSNPGTFYAVYLHHSDWGGKDERRQPSYEVRFGHYRVTLTLSLVAGTYEFSWFNPADLKRLHTERVSHVGGECATVTPAHTEDIFLVARRLDGS